jgi:hypothetical protein
MFLAKTQIRCLWPAVFCCLLVASTSYAVDAERMSPAEERAAARPAVCEADGEIDMPVGGEGWNKPFVWGNDATVATGDVQGGISAAYDSAFNQYAARCAEYSGYDRRRVEIYKSTNNGATWSLFKYFIAGGAYEFSYPKLLVCEYDPYKYLYLLYHRTDSEGQVRLARYNLDGSGSPSYYGVADMPAGDSVTYFSACQNIYGWGLTVAYEAHEAGDATPDLRTVRSDDYGATWIYDQLVDADGQHPDIAYGYNSYTYLVSGTTLSGDLDIEFRRSTNRGQTWGSATNLMNDSYYDDYPKVAAIHDMAQSAAAVWVIFNHDYANTGNLDLRYVYSTNSGTNWSSYKILANSSDYDEMAADLVCWRFFEYPLVHVSYVKYRMTSLIPPVWSADVYSAWSDETDPDNWRDLTKINDQRSSYSEDARRVCQGSIMNCFLFALAGYVYTGSLKAPASFNNLYWDGYCFTDVEEDEDQTARPSVFSLDDNYPNPFNPETNIGYFVPRACQVRLEVFNLLGQKIRTLVNEHQTAGSREVSWDGRNEAGEQVASGVYFYKLQAEDFTQTKKMVLIR